MLSLNFGNKRKWILFKVASRTKRFLQKCFVRAENHKIKQAIDLLKDSEVLSKKLAELDEIVAASDDKKYYIIRRNHNGIGLFTFVNTFLAHIAFAVSKGLIPVIDMQNYSNMYLEPEEVGHKNAWEFYFEQPYNVNLNEILAGQQYILSSSGMQLHSPSVSSLFDEKETKLWRTLSDKFVVLRQEVKDYIVSQRNNLIGNNNVLGVRYRGTDYAYGKPVGHPVQPTINELLEKVDKALRDWSRLDRIFLATEERAVVEKFIGKYQQKVVVNDQRYYDETAQDFSHQLLKNISFNRENDKYLKGLEYLTAMMILSNCDSIVGGMCAGTYAANYLNKKGFTYSYFFDKGVY